MTQVGLRHVPVLEDVIGTGVEIQPEVRPYQQLSDDPRTLAYSNMEPKVYQDLELKLAAARRFQDEIRFAAMRDGVSVGQTMAASGLGGGAAVPSDIVGNHDAGITTSIAVDEAARMQAIESAKTRIENIQRMANEAMQHQRTRSAAHQMRDAGYAAGTVTAGVLGAPGILADLSGYLVGLTAEEATVLMQKVATVVSDARNTATRYEHEKVSGGIPPHTTPAWLQRFP